ncbi:peptide/nickel transport system ATP-binding protein [Microbacterium halimionae]|uniref:Peptide/nickel transport system ATP-binding protein n=1 Tax=Microbacterium halimionae TaxID=1526413 RepID=A0A7W3JRL7_9MICO|nr:dipeptide/oligopeptide/nickel ABC transporter ATP-binding protein [Microbacterium halimionae]MBA8817623.1 peptide/nickel transport system ATP-binding protein [Microbacterium halimionae]NII94333.1 peptide/nickel transport system ATP-binding protein [Microbacterium halimionae]
MSILELESASFSYGASEVLRDVSLSVERGGAVGLVGESGAGKSTILRLLLGLDSPRSGTIRFEGEPLRLRDRALMRRFRTSVQPVFQDPYSSLDPRQRIDSIIAEPLRSLRIAKPGEIPELVAAAVASVGLEPDALARYPHEFSGGQRQRIAIARAIVSRPRVLLADEPVSALDVTTRVQVLDLLATLRREQGLALVMVSHDLGAVAAVCDHTIVLKDGQVVEAGSTSKILTAPESAYARELVAAAPRLPR